MAVSHPVRFRELRSLFHLLDETLDLWDDPGRWRWHFLAGLCNMVGDGRGGWSHVTVRSSSLAKENLIGPAPTWDVGWQDERKRRTFRKSVDAIASDPSCIPTMSPLLSRLTLHPPTVTASRRSLVDDSAWFGSTFYKRYGVPCDLNDFVISAAVLPVDGALSIFVVNRPVDAPPLELRHRLLIDLAHREVAPLIGSRLTAPGQASRDGLTQRQREVLTLLLDGHSEGEIASRLWRSPATIHDHVLAVYRHFRVRGRAELLSYLVRRRPRPV